MGGLKPDHKTISNFRRNNLKALKQVLKQCARLCMRLGLIDGKNGLIVNSEVISQSNDTNQFSDQVKKAEVVLEKEVNAACADAGYWQLIEKDRCREYLIIGSKTCSNCKHFEVCTKSEQGRRINRLFTEELKENLKKLYDSSEGQKIFRMRKARAELPFGYIKRNLEAGYFLLRGREGVNGEMGLLATSFNIKRMINLVGISALLNFLIGKRL